MKKISGRILLSIILLCNSLLPVNAAEQKVSEIKAQVPSSFSITLPKYITIGQDKTVDFAITATGDMASDEHISVTTDSTISLTSEDRESVSANVFLDKTQMSLLNGTDTITGKITTGNLTAGTWTSSIVFMINWVKGTSIAIGQVLALQSYDVTPIPDKYNTGVDKTTCVEEIPSVNITLENGLKFRDDNGNMCYLDFNKAPNKTASGEYVFENIDFSSKKDWVGYGNTGGYEGTGIKLIFNNCKFFDFKTNNYNDLIECEFNNCSFRSIACANIVLNNCFIGGQSEYEEISYDAIMPHHNAVFNNCYIADIEKKTEEAGSSHLDGMQSLGAKDLYFTNCRFEVPDINYTYSQGGFSYVIYLESSDVENVIFDHCYINGGGHYSISVTDLDPVNCRIIEPFIGCSFYGGGPFYPNINNNSNSAEAVTENPRLYDSLYVTSVWKKDDGTANVIVTNDTPVDRTLRIITEDGYTDYIIPKMLKQTEYEADTKDFADLPIDLKYTVAGNAEYIVCYDITDTANPRQIRFVNYGTGNVILQEDWGIIMP